MLLTACSAEAALAEETRAGVTYFITEVASMRGLRSAGIAALLLHARLSFFVTILHTVVMAQPSQSALSEQRIHTGRPNTWNQRWAFFLS